MKTLRVTLADIEGAAHASTAAATSVTVSVAYSGQVVLTSGTVIPAAVKSKNLGSSGVVDFSVYASDDPAVRSEYRGFAVVVTATVRGPVGSPTTKLVRSVKPLESMGSTIQLGSLPPAEGLPAQWVTVDEVISDFDARLDSLEDHPAAHAARHATGGPDPITPASIGALPDDDPRLLDTGWRKVTFMESWAGVTANREHLRRTGPTVTYTGQISAYPSNTYFQASAAIPSGFRASSVLSAAGFPLSRYPSSAAADLAASLGVNSSGTLTFKTHPSVSNALIFFTVSWLTDDPWPTTLPGTPA